MAITNPRARMAMGTLTKKTEPHQNDSSRKPLATIPRAPPAPANPDQMAIALARSLGGKTTVMIDRVAGMVSAAPTPMAPRSTISWLALSLRVATRAATRKMPRPTTRAGLRP